MEVVAAILFPPKERINLGKGNLRKLNIKTVVVGATMLRTRRNGAKRIRKKKHLKESVFLLKNIKCPFLALLVNIVWWRAIATIYTLIRKKDIPVIFAKNVLMVFN